MTEGSEQILQSSQPIIMDNISRQTTPVIDFKKVLQPTGRDSLSDNSQSIQSEPNNAIRIIRQNSNPISLNGNQLSVCYDRIIT
jgi:hypothetical protein